MSDNKLTWLENELQSLKDQGLFNTIRTIGSAQGAWIIVDGKRVLNFCSNNYLGIADHPRLKEAAQQAIGKYGVGPAAVRSIAGTLDLHVEFERRMAQFKGVEDALYVQSGFCANQAAIPPLVGKEDVIFTDRLNHASIIDGCRLSSAKISSSTSTAIRLLPKQRSKSICRNIARPAGNRWRLQHGRRHRAPG